MSKNIIVTGGAGFIGSHIVDLLIEKGFKVTVIDNLSNGRRENLNKEADFIHADILSIGEYSRSIKDAFAVIHCAAQISVSNSIRNPVNDAQINIIGSLRLLEMCRKLNIKKFLFASTGGAIYGSAPNKFPVSESQMESPESPYAVSKRSIELYMDFYLKNYGIDCVSLRYSNVYGPRQDDLGEAGVIAIFISKLLKKQRPTIFGDGNQTRDFVYVKDVAEANISALNKKIKSNRINIGTGVQTSINGLFSKISNLIGKDAKRIKPAYREKRKGDLKFSSLDIKLAKKELGWKPKTSLDEGLAKTIEWFQR